MTFGLLSCLLKKKKHEGQKKWERKREASCLKKKKKQSIIRFTKEEEGGKKNNTWLKACGFLWPKEKNIHSLCLFCLGFDICHFSCMLITCSSGLNNLVFACIDHQTNDICICWSSPLRAYVTSSTITLFRVLQICDWSLFIYKEIRSFIAECIVGKP